MKLLLISALSKTLQDQFYAPVEGHVRVIANELVNRGHDVTVVALQGSKAESFKLMEVGPNEEQAYHTYESLLDENDAVLDFSNLKYAYIHKHETSNLKLIGPCYPYQALGYSMAPPIAFPCFVATSEAMAQAMSAKLGCCFKVVNYFSTPQPVKDPIQKSRLLFLGRLEKGKGAQEAIDVARQLRVGLDIAGEDILVSDQRYTVLLLQKADGKLIRVFGRVAEALKYELLAKAKALIIPYLEDSGAWTCQTILEAFQCGTPIITMNRGAVNEFVEHGVDGFICDSLQDLPQAVSDLNTIDSSACIKTSEQFSLKIAVDKYEKLLTGTAEW